jgi:plasmid stabilization system protein ParE
VKRSIRLSVAARRDFARLAEFLTVKSAPTATRATEAISSAVRSLEEFAERGHPMMPPGWRELSVRFGRYGYVIRYRIDGDVVFVTRIFHVRERR